MREAEPTSSNVVLGGGGLCSGNILWIYQFAVELRDTDQESYRFRLVFERCGFRFGGSVPRPKFNGGQSNCFWKRKAADVAYVIQRAT